jgi:hypothetical protein
MFENPGSSLNPFAPRPIKASTSMFSREKPKANSLHASEDKIAELKQRFGISEYLGKMMNTETRAFFEALVEQWDDASVMHLLDRDDVIIDKEGCLKVFVCSFSTIKSLPDLPEGLEELIVSYSSIDKLPLLPKSLKILECTGSPLADDRAQIKEIRISNPHLSIYD